MRAEIIPRGEGSRQALSSHRRFKKKTRRLPIQTALQNRVTAKMAKSSGPSCWAIIHFLSLSLSLTQPSRTNPVDLAKQRPVHRRQPADKTCLPICLFLCLFFV